MEQSRIKTKPGSLKEISQYSQEQLLNHISRISFIYLARVSTFQNPRDVDYLNEFLYDNELMRKDISGLVEVTDGEFRALMIPDEKTILDIRNSDYNDLRKELNNIQNDFSYWQEILVTTS